jgi:hypothetical protein
MFNLYYIICTQFLRNLLASQMRPVRLDYRQWIVPRPESAASEILHALPFLALLEVWTDN